MRTTTKVFLTIVAGLAVTGLIAIREQPQNDGKPLAWNVYCGEFGGFEITIEEFLYYDQEAFRVVALHPIGKPTYVSITGYYVGDEPMKLAQMFSCGMPNEENDCLPATSLSPAEIAIGEEMLSIAIAAIHDKSHLIVLADHRGKLT